MKKLLFTTSFILWNTIGFSQVEIIKDDRINGLIEQEGAPVPPSNVTQMIGYRVQLFFDSNKTLIDEARIKFQTLYPKVDTYVSYTAPHYFLKVGDFRTQMEAEGVKAAMQSQFPTSFVVKEKINLPRID